LTVKTLRTDREGHDFCSPSQLYMRNMCPGSVRLEQSIEKPERSGNNSDAQRGIVLHDLASLVLQGKLTLEVSSHKEYELVGNDLTDVAWCVNEVKYLMEQIDQKYTVLYEYQVDLSALGISGGKNGNRIDVLIMVPGVFAVVIDFKFGVGYVSHPSKNLQFKGYAYGVMKKFGIKNVMCVKLQPAIKPEWRYAEYTFGEEELIEAGEEIRAIVESTKLPDAPLVRGDHCHFCTAKSICEHWSNAVLSIPRHMHPYMYLKSIDPVQRREVFDKLKDASKWVGDAIAACKGFILDGGYVHGKKVTDGARRRCWKDNALAKKTLRKLAKEHGKKMKDVLQPAMPISVAKAEELFGKDNEEVVEALAPLIKVTIGDPTVKNMTKAELKEYEENLNNPPREDEE
jgi:CRISPR/Cas system-associated exonuclease Cas4 (RecB family)